MFVLKKNDIFLFTCYTKEPKIHKFQVPFGNVHISLALVYKIQLINITDLSVSNTY